MADLDHVTDYQVHSEVVPDHVIGSRVPVVVVGRNHVNATTVHIVVEGRSHVTASTVHIVVEDRNHVTVSTVHTVEEGQSHVTASADQTHVTGSLVVVDAQGLNLGGGTQAPVVIRTEMIGAAGHLETAGECSCTITR